MLLAAKFLMLFYKCSALDLKEAAAPFETAETLKKFRNLQLGIGTDESEVGRSEFIYCILFVYLFIFGNSC